MGVGVQCNEKKMKQKKESKCVENQSIEEELS